MYSKRHLVKKAIFDIQFPDEKTAFNGRKNLVNFFSQSLLPILENAFDTYAQGEQIYHINRLEFDLGYLNLEQLDPILMRQTILRQLNRQWQEQSLEIVNVVATSRSLEETFMRFLATGALPWQSIVNNIEEMETAMQSLNSTELSQIISRILPLLQQPSIRLRLAYQFSNIFFKWFIQQLHPESSEQLLQIGLTILGELESPPTKDALLAIAIALPRNYSVESTSIEEQLLAYNQSVSSTALKIIPTELEQSSSKSLTGELPPQELNDLRQQLPNPSLILGAEDEGWYIHNAGIVLLHPFLIRFFAGLSLLNQQRQFIAVESQMKAVHALHYLAIGEEQPSEHETVLYKVLCGFSVEQPLIRQLALSQQDKAESEDLLSAVIQHWDKLKNTSPDGLRQAFLQRDGKLIKQQQGWKLIVEQRSVDILLDYLPWNLSIVRLPWMDSLLSVDWA